MPLDLITATLCDKKKYCLICFNELKNDNLHELIHNDINICPKCLKELSPLLKEDKVEGIKGEYLYSYSDLMKEKIYTFKGCGDIVLAKAFLNYYKNSLRNKYRGYILIPAPSDINSDNARGFNHVEEIFKELNLPMIKLLYKTINYKQADLSKKERENVVNKITIKNLEKIHNKKVLFVDDISTTGSTLKACLRLIKKGQPRKMHFLVVAKVINLTRE